MKNLEKIIACTLKHFRKAGLGSAVFVALENNMYVDTFKNFGFIARPEKKHFYIYLDENIQDKSYLLDSKNWFITIGDCDVERM